MDVIEKAIRNAFAKGDPEDGAFREKVYRSAFAALDRALQANPQTTVQAAMTRRKALQATVAEIESEYLPAAPPDVLPDTAASAPSQAAPPIESSAPPVDRVGEAPRVSIDPAARDVAPDIVPDMLIGGDPATEDFSVIGELPAEPLVATRGKPVDVGTADRRSRARERRRPYAAIFFAVTVLSLVAIVGLFAMQTGLFKSAAERDTSVPNPPAETGSEDFVPDGSGPPPLSDQAVDQRNWITVFTPKTPALANAPGDTKADVLEDETGSFLRVRSGPSGSAVSFDVGQGILEQIAGKKAVFDIVARAEEGKETQISIDCNFGDLGDCGRKRYLVGYERGEFLFDVTLPDKPPGASGSIAINSDLDSAGKAVDIYEIRVALTE